MSKAHPMRAFVDSTPVRDDPVAVRERLDRDGYVFLREFVPRDVLIELRRAWLEIIADGGWLRPQAAIDRAVAEVDQACVDPEPRYRAVYERIWRLEEFHALPHHPQIMGWFERLFGEPALVHPRLIGRIIFPRVAGRDDFTTPIHQDFPAIQGSTRTLSIWIPLGDVPREHGPLCIAAGCHRWGVLETEPALGTGGWRILDPRLDDSWVSGDFQLGDAAIFNTMTPHCALPNETDRLRLSVDFRYQPATEPITDSCINLEGSGLTWESVYAAWRSTRYQYFWKALGPRTVPYDRTFMDRRDDKAFALAAAGDRRSISTLHRIVAADPDPAKRQRAMALLADLTRYDAG